MVIWFSSGMGLLVLLRPLLRFASPVLLVVMVLALWVLPWSKQRLDDMQQQYEKRGDIERLEPGQFQESANGQRVFFIDKDASGKIAGSNVFIASSDDGKDTITSARSGRIETVGTDRFLVLENGQRLDRMTEQSGLKVSEFTEYRVKVGEDILGSEASTSVHSRSTWGLIQGGTAPDLAELSWRIGLILAAINFTVIGLAVSSVNPRVGRSANVIFALFAFVVYFNLLNLGQNWISSKQLSFGGLMLGLHGGVLVITLFWLIKNHNNWQGWGVFKRGLKRRSKAQA
jgi:lipopolysaccharide export system permease protein